MSGLAMGHRANLVIVKNGRYDLFYSHWAANTLPQDLFWGPDLATAFIQIQRQADESDWLDDVWAEGGAVLDQDHRTLVLFGGDDLAFDVPLRRLYLELLGKVWKGWHIRWAHEGIVDIAEYLGYPRNKVLSTKSQPSWQCTLSPPQEESWTDIVGSVASVAGLRLFPLAGDVRSYLSCGPQLAEVGQTASGLQQFDFSDKNRGFPTGGFHLDLTRKKVEYWVANPEPNLFQQLTGAWPDWSVTTHRDSFEFQLERVGPALQFPVPSRTALLDRVREILMWEPQKSPVETLLSLTDCNLPEVKEVEINPYALRDDRITLSRNDKEVILEHALAALG